MKGGCEGKLRREVATEGIFSKLGENGEKALVLQILVNVGQLSLKMQPLGSQDELYKLENFCWSVSRLTETPASCLLSFLYILFLPFLHKNHRKNVKIKNRKNQKKNTHKERKTEASKGLKPHRDGSVARNRATIEAEKKSD